MRPPLIAGKPISYRALRSLQICTVFFFAIIVQEWIGYPRAGWTGFAVMMIYAGFDSGTTVLRAFHRFIGMFIGLFIGYVFWFIGHLDYRTLIVLLPMSVFAAYFFAGRIYSVPTTFVVVASVIGVGFFNVDPTATVSYYVEDYSLTTAVAFVMILIFEYFWFRHYGMMRRFIIDTQAEVLQDLYNLVYLLNQGNVHHINWCKCCIKLTRSLHEVEVLIQSVPFMIRYEQAVGGDFVEFVSLANRIFIGLKALYISSHAAYYQKIDVYQHFQKVQAELVELKKFITEVEQLGDTTLGEMYATPH